MRPDTPFHIASITKTFTAVAVLKLVDEQRLSLDASLLQLLHADVILRIANAERVTIRQLLDHTSGIYATNNDLAYLTTVIGPNADPLLVWTPEEIVALADRARSRPLGEPGEAHFYSDTNYVLLSMIVAGIAGIPFKKYVTDRIFYPLAMNDTYYYSDRLPVRGLANVKTTHGYLLATEEIRNLIDINRMYEAIPGVQREGVSLLDVTLASERIDGASGIVSTLPDLNRFAKALFGGGLLSDSSQSFLMSVGTGMQDEPLDRRRICALRALRKEFGALIFAEGDSPGGVNTLLAYAPASQTIYAGVVNMFGSFDEVDWMTDDVIAKLDAR
jgi:D-alanyl-D-alanine carboxypeptidase